MRDILVLGTGGTSREIAEAIEAINAVSPTWRMVGYLDDDLGQQGRTPGGHAVVGRLAEARLFEGAFLINGIGSPRNYVQKREIIAQTGLPNERFATIVHPLASVSPSAVVAPGAALLAHVVVGAEARIGQHVVVLPHTYVGHHTRIGECSCVAAGVAIGGNCEVGADCYLGMGCLVRDGLAVGEGALVGMGAVVVRSVPSRCVSVGNPARPVNDGKHPTGGER
jgi:sugar O-acyltransferase (sialic acid O-acetyltransferase NeuD family)